MEISQVALEANDQISNATSPGQVLNEILNRFLGWPYKAASGQATDRENAKTETFASLVFVASDPDALREPVTVSADALAAVIDMSEQMDLPKFRAAYQKIAFAKSLKKTRAPRLKGTAHTNTTLGIVFAIRAEVPLEKFAEELDKLNRETPSNQWPDMVTVLSKGTINLAGQFPGEQISADILPPAEGSLEAYTPPMDFVMVIRPTGLHSFNKMAAFLVAHLAIFSPGAKVPIFTEILKGVPQKEPTKSHSERSSEIDLALLPRRRGRTWRAAPPLPASACCRKRARNPGTAPAW